MDKTLIINTLIQVLNFNSDSDFARFLGITPQVLSNWKNRNSYDAQLIYTKCVNINPHWLLTGEGEVLKTETVVVNDTIGQEYGINYKDLAEARKETIDCLKKEISHLEEKIISLSDKRQAG